MQARQARGRGWLMNQDLPQRRATSDRPAILLVEDDAGFRQATQSLLERAGYEVLAVADYRPALEILESSRRLDLLLTDIVMPDRIHGLALARMGRMRRPALKIIYMTGYDLGSADAE